MDEHRLPAYGCWIDGEKIEGRNHYPLVDPSTGKPFAVAVEADAVLVERAVKSAREGFRSWKSFSAAKRAELLHGLAAGMREEAESLAELLGREVGKTVAAARDEVLSSARLLDYFAEEGARLNGTIPLLGHPREHVLVVREPVGVVAAVTPYNYPLSALACKLGPALASGCSVVVKPDEHTPLATLRVAELGSTAGIPPGVVNVVTGSGPGPGRLLVENPVPRLVSFTGSTRVGKEIQAGGARWVRKTILELGGHCPAFVLRDAPWREALPRLVSQCFKNCGQYCYRVSRIYLDAPIYEEFGAEFIRAAAELRVGSAHDPQTHIGPLNNREILQRVSSQVETALREGASPLFIGETPKNTGGFFYPLTVLADVKSHMSITRQEVFGPVVILTPFETIGDAVGEANASPYGLAAYLFSADLALAMEWAGKIEAGSVWINRIHQSYPQAPFGGMKESGLGREKSRFGLEEYTELKTIYLSY